MQYAAESVDSGRRTAPPLILLAERDPETLRAVERVLRTDGYEIERAEDGAQALVLVASDDVDLLIADERMPDMEGTSLLRLVRTRSPLTSCVLLWPERSLAAIHEGELAGARAVLFLPLNELLLRKTVRRLLPGPSS